MKIILNNHEYTLLVGYQRDDGYRFAFDQLAVKTFNLSFESWYQSGYWKDKYIPYTLGFTPKDTSAYESEEISNDDALFIQEGKTQLFDENKVMFPLLSHA